MKPTKTKTKKKIDYWTFRNPLLWISTLLCLMILAYAYCSGDLFKTPHFKEDSFCQTQGWQYGILISTQKDYSDVKCFTNGNPNWRTYRMYNKIMPYGWSGDDAPLICDIYKVPMIEVK